MNFSLFPILELATAAAVFTESTEKIHPAIANVSSLLLPHKSPSGRWAQQVLQGLSVHVAESCYAQLVSWPPGT